ncbi:hypothetical protein FTUN_8261 [Frigoriglobus tundricola]|uniref:Uncharacterized protein n=1 Tax=Frigoriglobus tundricola TaxID=2774151 RepID=A0A6M5Z2Z8_9BACT|nr:hypothetical protein FTUN_8261 [Frigoriglobus tundricola]
MIQVGAGPELVGREWVSATAAPAAPDVLGGANGAGNEPLTPLPSASCAVC